MGDRGAEHSHDRVTDELLNRGTITFQLAPQPTVIGAESSHDVFGVSPVSPAGRADQVAEEHCDDLPLLGQAPGTLGQHPAAVSTEMSSRSGLSPAPHAPGHVRKSRQRCHGKRTCADTERSRVCVA